MNKYFYQYVIGVPRAIVKWTAKVTLEHTMEAQGGVEVWLYFILNLGARGGWVVNATPWPLPPPTTLVKEIRYPLCRRLSGPQGRSGRVWNISPRDWILGPSSP